MRMVIVTGMSGAGRFTAMKILEDMKFYCVDNLPIPLVGKFAELMQESRGEIENAALGIDIRTGDELPALQDTLDDWDRKHIAYEILYLEASDDTLVRRFKESRRDHPLQTGERRLEDGIALEREKLAFLKKRATYIIDTSNLLVRELKTELSDIFQKHAKFSSLNVTVLSFGFKYGIPIDADLVFDVRFLPNPYYVPELKRHTGNDPAVQAYVRRGGVADEFMRRLTDLINFLLPHYVREGKNSLVIAVGCTGGRHRSVTVANMLAEKLRQHEDIGLKLEHRDIDRDRK
ncbi:RNase adapter RapZ [Clostridium vitabionis]|uniref:RNase adapter RapZ n=1 Tax=Clostridium vitabionis TaxID=2784388 RepID=UPI00188BD147|nr:RNase adapter RapZ [Clostridium vitabionis]